MDEPEKDMNIPSHIPIERNDRDMWFWNCIDINFKSYM